ncbi:endonuclease/exonuclease/phosphatase family protein [Pedobacter heparinus]|uniref:endonuclease/exonuclease/phosphatase family protein n=1 Tax=Pedobacter heparinus TaxID=984 RepID=UPI00292FBDFB|nr:endonuclease/exonuclease/phosphatase family protein [Pedobacter heparinus]
MLFSLSFGCQKDNTKESISQGVEKSVESSQASPQALRLKVLHYNICGNVCWESTDAPSGGVDTRGSVSRMATILTAIDNNTPHLITFNEICYSQYRNIRADLIARGYGSTYSSSMTGGQCDDYDSSWGTGFGDAIFYKGTVPSVQQKYLLPPSPSDVALGRNLQLLCVDVTFDGRQVKLCTTHVTTDAAYRPAQIQDIADRAATWIAAGIPVVITGDFNAIPTDPVMDKMYSHSGGTGNFQEADESNSCPSPLTFCQAGERTFGEVGHYYNPAYVEKKLDYIFFSAAHFTTPNGDAKSAFPTPISDHNLYVGDANLP